MNLYRIGLIALLSLLPALTAAQAPQKEALGSIQGTVINAITKEPVDGAVVELTWIERGRVLNRYVVTGETGRFNFDGLQPASDYELTATETSSFLPAAFGQKSPADPWIPIALNAGQNLSDLRIRLVPLSEIKGRILDVSGKPFDRAYVYLLRAIFVNGRRMLEQASYPASTNSKGEYYFGGLGAGQYYIRAVPPNDGERTIFENPSRFDAAGNTRSGEPQGFPSTYHPGTMDITAAEPVNLLNAEKASNINVVLAKVQTRRLSGSVLLESTPDAAPVTATTARVLLFPRSTGAESHLTRSTTAVAGQFDFRAVLPGKYYLDVTTDDGRTRLKARQAVDVLDADLRKLSITATRGFDIPGKIRFANWEQEAPPDYSQLAINLVPEALTPIDQSLFRGQVQTTPFSLVPSANGEFVLRNVAPGDYRLVISLNPNLPANSRLPSYLRNTYMSTAQIGETEVLNNGMHINGKPDGTLDMVLASDSGALYGRVLDDGNAPEPPIRTIIVPDLARRKRLDLYSPLEVTSSGRFSVGGIPPGDYKIFSWAHVEIGAWFDPMFLRAYEERGTPVHIEADVPTSVEVKLIH